MRLARIILLLILALLTGREALVGGSLTISVTDRNGAPVSDAVVYATATGSNAAAGHSHAVIDQENKLFIPYVTAVQVGASIVFPNRDHIRHHVYSLSPTKRFELPLYAGIPAAPVVFDKVGFVTLGCNIHDWMVAYVAVLPTPYFGVTGSNGRITLKDLPPGGYLVTVWHPLLKGSPDQLGQQLSLTSKDTNNLTFTLDLKPDFRTRRAPELSTGGYP